MELMPFLAKEAAQSISGMTLECAHWPGYETAWRWISRQCIGDWMPSAEKALENYKNKLDL